MKLRIVLFLIIGMFAGSATCAQKPAKKIIIAGEVKDRNNNPVPDAIVMIDGVKTNAFTNQNGYYKVKVKSSAQKIGIMSTAGIPEEAINGRTIINFNLAGAYIGQNTNQVKTPDETVEVGYGKVKKRDLTGSVGKVDATKNKYSSYNSIYDMLKGEVAGVEVNGRSIRIRGASSLQSGTEPLFVVDGVTAPSIDDIMPQMVKSIEVLKGPSAAIYGSRGANGVILITLKK